MPCGPVIIFPPCPTPACPDVTPVDLSNGNLTGIGTLDSFVGQAGVFRGVVGDGVWITATLNAGNKAIEISFDDTNITAAIPQATEATAGIGEVATQAETDAGVSDITFITPLKLGARAATTTLTGLVELATSAETVTGVDATRAVTPSGLSIRLASQKTTQTFANAAARAAAQPAFDGQFGSQLDTEMVYTATGLLPGNWQQSFIQPNTTTTFSGNTEFALNGNAFTLSDGATDHLAISAGTMQFNGEVQMLAASILNFVTGATLEFNSVVVPASSVFGTGVTAGRPQAYPISDFLSVYNQEGWAAPTGTLDRTTFDDATVTLPELAQRVAALLTDLLAVKLPQVP